MVDTVDIDLRTREAHRLRREIETKRDKTSNRKIGSHPHNPGITLRRGQADAWTRCAEQLTGERECLRTDTGETLRWGDLPEATRSELASEGRAAMPELQDETSLCRVRGYSQVDKTAKEIAEQREPRQPDTADLTRNSDRPASPLRRASSRVDTPPDTARQEVADHPTRHSIVEFITASPCSLRPREAPMPISIPLPCAPSDR